MPTSADCRKGDAALRRGAWAEAREAFAAELSIEETPEALEGLGLASWWLDLADDVFDSRERAYRLFVDRNDRSSAARVAVWLAWDSCAFRGETAVANGWLRRARRLLDGLPDCSEHASLELREGALALVEDGEPDRANDHAARGIRVAQGIGSKDLELLGRALQGLALVAAGAVAEGMCGLDEVNAAVVAGEMTDLVRARARAGDLEGARIGLAELNAIATVTKTPSLHAAARFAAGQVALAGDDAGEAQRSFEDAIDLFLECGAPYEVARVRIELARALGTRDRVGAAVREARQAIELLQELGAELEISRAQALIESLTSREESPLRHDEARAGLTNREIEVLRLVAADLKSQVIARRLSLSEHTVHRHIANIFHKLSVSSRAAAVAQAARRDLLG